MRFYMGCEINTIYDVLGNVVIIGGVRYRPRGVNDRRYGEPIQCIPGVFIDTDSYLLDFF